MSLPPRRTHATNNLPRTIYALVWPAADGTIHSMKSRGVAVHSPDYWCDIGAHVFPMEKFALVRQRLVEGGDLADAEVLAPEPAPRVDLELVHTREYLDDLEQLRWTPRTACSELPLSLPIVQAYVLAAGGTTLAARLALEAGVGINLGGGFHHAFADLASGFCYINDLAVAVRVLQRDGLIRRAAIVDCDLHQGNGTAHIFRHDDTVFTFSIHQQDLYPVKETSDLDIGLANGAGDAEFNGRLAEALPHVWDHGPDLLLYQAGADPFEDDQLGALKLTVAGLAERDRLVLDGCAARGIPLVVTLGGGYARRLADTVEIHVQTCRLGLRSADRYGERTQ